MKVPTMIETADSATNLFAWVLSGLIALIAFGVAAGPFLSLPDRVQSNEAAIREITGRLDKSEDKLDVLICFHQAEINGTDAKSCSLR